MPKASVTPGTIRLSARRGADSSIQVALCGRRSMQRWVDARRRTSGAVGLLPRQPVFRHPDIASTLRFGFCICICWCLTTLSPEQNPCLLRFCMGEHLASQQHDARCSQRCPSIKRVLRQGWGPGGHSVIVTVLGGGHEEVGEVPLGKRDHRSSGRQVDRAFSRTPLTTLDRG
ncbi:hypothetical protein SNOG_13396 [Parastagonospora nodorum SN15]|uniref:Uncharacterized protein n=1 Tax=Phaeosphaeria nodorum (strain SN15 / ATCC MYA-4574 / FGSC 10173) TaxID=321614 RepID=Q0U4B8_PHANO|nr:hypothetical protein SNOG_13396 [Parastagonospora nodorum SN15]EAT79280.1 hypothetical protein SNOG_13396 [Parastagonospora nodorum SN15]